MSSTGAAQPGVADVIPDNGPTLHRSGYWIFSVSVRFGKKSEMTRRVPDDIKVVRGTFRKDRARPDGEVKAASTKPPVTISKEARKFWRELQPGVAYMISDRDRQALALTCEALAQHQAAAAIIAAQGSTYEAVTEAGAILVRERPEVRIAADAWRRALRGLAEFGLTPASRCRVPQPLQPRKPNPFAVLSP